MIWLVLFKLLELKLVILSLMLLSETMISLITVITLL